MADGKFKQPLWVAVCLVPVRLCSYLGGRNSGHFDALLKQHTQDAVLLLQVKHTSPQLHTFLFQVLEKKTGTGGQINVADGNTAENSAFNKKQDTKLSHTRRRCFTTHWKSRQGLQLFCNHNAKTEFMDICCHNIKMKGTYPSLGPLSVLLPLILCLLCLQCCFLTTVLQDTIQNIKNGPYVFFEANSWLIPIQ